MPQDEQCMTPSDSDDGDNDPFCGVAQPEMPSGMASSSSQQQQHVQPSAEELTELESCLAEFAKYDGDYGSDYIVDWVSMNKFQIELICIHTSSYTYIYVCNCCSVHGHPKLVMPWQTSVQDHAYGTDL